MNRPTSRRQRLYRSEYQEQKERCKRLRIRRPSVYRQWMKREARRLSRREALLVKLVELETTEK